MKRVLVVGASSVVGANIALRLREKHHVFGTFFRNSAPIDGVPMFQLEMLPTTSWGELLKRLQIDVVYYCAAERDEKFCQEQPLHALAVNAEVPEVIARELGKLGGRMVYFSSSKVFSGEEGNYAEDAERKPLGHYAQSKARAEDLLGEHPGVFILRLGTVYGLGPVASRSLFQRRLQTLQEGRAETLIKDEVRSFHSAEWISQAAERLLEAQEDQAGLYHLPAPPKLSHYGFAVAMAKALGLSAAQLKPIPGQEFEGSDEPRGRDTSLRGSLFQKTFRIQPESTAKYLESLGEGLSTGQF